MKGGVGALKGKCKTYITPLLSFPYYNFTLFRFFWLHSCRLPFERHFIFTTNTSVCPHSLSLVMSCPLHLTGGLCSLYLSLSPSTYLPVSPTSSSSSSPASFLFSFLPVFSVTRFPCSMFLPLPVFFPSFPISPSWSLHLILPSACLLASLTTCFPSPF